jgi:transcriptional regulator with PAS, ATPase and Fis domain
MPTAESRSGSSLALGGIVGRSPRMRELFADIRRAASSDANVLILGESGVGKERAARAIHEHGTRRAGPFLAINCAAIPESLLEAELFGYERGAFTGAQVAKGGLLEAADGGTVLLDEVCELHPSLQAKLLRAVEEGAVRRLGGKRPSPLDVRFVASTNRTIREEMRQGRFREDLFFRLDVIEIRVPPLRERREDIPLLAAHFLGACSARNGKKIEKIENEAIELLVRHSWPGNVRELKNAIERAFAYTGGPVITRGDLPEAVLQGAQLDNGYGFRGWKQRTLERLEREFLATTLAVHGGNVSRAAKALRIHRSTLQRLMRSHRLATASRLSSMGALLQTPAD